VGIVVPLNVPWHGSNPPTLSKRQLARDIGRSTRTIERWMDAGLPHSRDRRDRACFILSEVLGWLDEREEAS